MDRNVDKFIEKLNLLSITYNQEQIDKFLKYYDMLVEKNKVMNLTAITEFEEVVEKHFIDSLAIVKIVDMKDVNSIIDIGTGAGFPGIPLKIMFPHVKITLIDSLNKRINFLNEVIEKLELDNISAYHGRAEDFGRNNDYREKYDLCVSRAVAHLSSLSEYCLPFVRKNGYFISYKAGECEEEINASKNAIKLLSGRIDKIEKFSLPDSEISRSFIKISKIKNLSNKYPRKSGVPAKNPL